MTSRFTIPLLLGASFLAGCDNEPKQPKPDEKAAAQEDFAATASRIAANTRPPNLVAPVSNITLTPGMPGYSMTLVNAGANPVEIKSRDIIGSDAIKITGCSGTVAADSSCTLQVTYTPRAGEVAGVINIQHTGESKSISISVSGGSAETVKAPAAPNNEELLRAANIIYMIQSAAAPVTPQFEYQPAPQAPAPQYPIPPQHPAAFTKPAGPSRDLSRVVTKGHVIEAAATTEIFAEVPVEARFQISYPIYPLQRHAGQNARIPLIPAGSTLEGICAPSATTNLRANCYFGRLRIDSTGQMIALGQATAFDQMGRPGVDGHYERRLVERFGPGILMSGVSAATLLASPDSTTTFAGTGGALGQSQSASRRAADQLSTDLQAIARQILNEDRSVSPRLTISMGEILTFRPTSDIYMPLPGEIYSDPAIAQPLTPPNAGNTNFQSLAQQPLNYQQGNNSNPFNQNNSVLPFNGQYSTPNYMLLQSQAMAAQAGQGQQ